MKACDLHTHSIYSDGSYTPTEIIRSAAYLGLSAVALTDHNTIDGVPEFMAAAEKYGIEGIAGAEFSANYNGKELHLLGLWLPDSSFKAIDELLDETNRSKDRSNVDLITSLAAAGFEVDYNEIKESTPTGKFNRAHIAAHLTKKGYVSTIDEAFKTVLSPSAGHYKEPKRPDIFELIDFIRDIGAVSVLAHPFLKLDEEDLCSLLPKARERGLCGMQCLYSQNDEETTRLSFDIADRFGLAYSGGSDFHGSNKPNISLGSGKGNLLIPYEYITDLKNKGLS